MSSEDERARIFSDHISKDLEEVSLIKLYSTGMCMRTKLVYVYLPGTILN